MDIKNAIRLAGPLAPSQRILETATGEIWKVIIREQFRGENGAITEERRFRPSGARKCLYLYGCAAEDRDDERVVFDDQIGTKYRLLG